MKFKLTPLEKKWILYDVGNSAFTLLIATLLPIYFDTLADGAGLSEANYLAAWGYATSLATILVALTGPIIGTVSDSRGRKKPLFLASILLGSIACLCLGFARQWLAFLAVFVLAKAGYSVSLIIYDSMLPDVTEPERMDTVSSQGYAWGYIGSVIPFIISLLFVLFYEQIGLSFSTAMLICFGINALWWAGCTLPLAKAYRQKHYVPAEKHVIRHTFARLANTFKNVKRNRKCFLFLLAFFFYIDGVYTIMEMATAYGTSLGLSQNGLLLALLLTQVVAFPAALTFGALSKRFKSETLIKAAIIAYFCIAIYALFLTNLVQFWILAVAVGLFQGGIQALSRSYFARIIPENASGEYFGLFDICGKGATFLGTMIVGIVTQLTGIQNIAVGCLAFLFLVGYIIFSKVAKMPDIPVPEEYE